MKEFGIIGNPLEHSFSPHYFSEKFAREQIAATYQLYTLPTIEALPALLKEHAFVGLNVTYPFKKAVIPYLDALDETAQQIGAVNVVAIQKGKRVGYNTDCIGFEKSLLPLLVDKADVRALILGTGGAAQAVAYVLQKQQIPFQYVSRDTSKGLTYAQVTPDIMSQHKLIINCTPLGMYPNIDACPAIPYEAIGSQHLLYDLVYNPVETLFLQKGAAQGAKIKNGLEMLQLQAEAAWNLWKEI